jgi:hypothetical protein
VSTTTPEDTMAEQSRDKVDELMQGLQQLIEAGEVDEVEQVLSTLAESEPAQDLSPEERETRSYARGVRDGLTLARRAPEDASG